MQIRNNIVGVKGLMKNKKQVRLLIEIENSHSKLIKSSKFAPRRRRPTKIYRKSSYEWLMGKLQRWRQDYWTLTMHVTKRQPLVWGGSRLSARGIWFTGGNEGKSDHVQHTRGPGHFNCVHAADKFSLRDVQVFTICAEANLTFGGSRYSSPMHICHSNTALHTQPPGTRHPHQASV